MLSKIIYVVNMVLRTSIVTIIEILVSKDIFKSKFAFIRLQCFLGLENNCGKKNKYVKTRVNALLLCNKYEYKLLKNNTTEVQFENSKFFSFYTL